MTEWKGLYSSLVTLQVLERMTKIFNNKLHLLAIKLMILSLVFESQNIFADTIKVAVFKDHYSEIYHHVSNGRCPDIESFVLNDNQMLAEFLIFCNALKRADYNHKINLIAYPVSKRALQAIEKSDVIASGYGLWHTEIVKHNLQVSQHLLNNNEFTKGLYTTKVLSQKLNNKNEFNASELIVLANQNWVQDWTALNCTELNLVHVDRYEQMFKMLELGRAELLPLTFSAKKNLQRTAFNSTLFPIHGVKVTFSDSLHFGVNTSSKQGVELYSALSSGLTSLKNEGVIEDVYKRLGVTNPRVKNWNELGCDKQ